MVLRVFDGLLICFKCVFVCRGVTLEGLMLNSLYEYRVILITFKLIRIYLNVVKFVKIFVPSASSNPTESKICFSHFTIFRVKC